MKMISINVEGLTHIQRVEPFLTTERAEVVCIQEGTEVHVQILEKLGYTVSFLPRCIRTYEGTDFTDGLIIASLHPVTFTSYNYFKVFDDIRHEIDEVTHIKRRTPRFILQATVLYEGNEYVIGTTHFTWTPDGDTATEAQQENMVSFQDIVKTLPPHVMCGDFNIPRHYHKLYSNLADIYKDEIPENFKSSLDPVLHKMRHDEVQREKLSRYMVDYIFTQPPYTAENVRLEFGISDHAGVVANIHKN